MCNSQLALGIGKSKMKDSGTQVGSDNPNDLSLHECFPLTLSPHRGGPILFPPSIKGSICLLQAWMSE